MAETRAAGFTRYKKTTSNMEHDVIFPLLIASFSKLCTFNIIHICTQTIDRNCKIVITTI